MITPESQSASGRRTAMRAPRGLDLSCKGWQQEAALRMLMNSLDEEVAEGSRNAVTVGEAAADAARNEKPFEAIARLLRALENNETLLVHAGDPACVAATQEDAPRVLVCNELAHRAQYDDAREQELAPLLAYREMIATSWLQIGPQEVVQAIYQIFRRAGEARFAVEQGSAIPELSGKLIVSGGMGQTGGAQPIAATMAGAAFLGIDVDAESVKRRLRSGYCDFMINSVDEALRILKNAVRKRENVAVGLVGNCADVLPELADRGVVPDIVTDLTPADDPRTGYVPNGMTLAEALDLRTCDAETYAQRARAAVARQVEAMLRLQRMGSLVFDFGNGIRAAACEQGVTNAYQIPSVAQYFHKLYGEGDGPLRCVALSGLRADIAAADELALQMFPQNRSLRRWIEMARQRIREQALPARIYRLCQPEQASFALAVNRLVAEGKIKAPVVLARDRLTSKPLSGARPTAAEDDGRLLQRLLNGASGASLVSICKRDAAHCCSQEMIVADGTAAMARRIERLFNGSLEG